MLVGHSYRGMVITGVADRVPEHVDALVLFGTTEPRVQTPIDPSLTLTRTQYPAIVGNRGNRKPLSYAAFASPCNTQQPLTDHS